VRELQQRQQMISGRLYCFWAVAHQTLAVLPGQANLGLGSLHTRILLSAMALGPADGHEPAPSWRKLSMPTNYCGACRFSWASHAVFTRRTYRLPECRADVIGGCIVFFASLPDALGPNIVPQGRPSASSKPPLVMASASVPILSCRPSHRARSSCRLEYGIVIFAQQSC
jgi:hypothetical protein